MYKQHLLFAIEREIDLIKQLGTFIEEKDLAFRPHESVRSTLELMQYLSSIGAYAMRWVWKNDITDEVRQQVRDYRGTLTLANFSERMDEQMNEIRAYMKEISEEDLLHKDALLPTRETLPLGLAIMQTAIKWLTAYRMELFVYVKMNGKPQLSTREAWTVLKEPATN
jgi:hypothetical protein